MFPRILCLFGTLGLLSLSAEAAVRLHELCAATSQRTLRWPDGAPARPGAGPAWMEAGFTGIGWQNGNEPLGYGQSGLGTNVQSALQGITPSLYLRKTFTPSAADRSSGSQLRLRLKADDGYVVFLNGQEILRRNMGPAGLPSFHDQEAFRAEAFDQTLDLGIASTLLRDGLNILAIQVHNVDLGDADLVASAQLSLASGSSLIPAGASWSWFAGRLEPSGGLHDPTLAAPDFADWVELYNDGASAVDLSNWSLSNRADGALSWIFPVGTSIPAGGYLVVLMDGAVTPVGSPWLHASFSLDKDGEYLGLRDAGGGIVDAIEFPRQDYFHSYGRIAGGLWRYFETPRPGAANPSSGLTTAVKKPVFSVPGGHALDPVTVALTSDTSSATIRYTTDGSEPSLTRGQTYSAPLRFTANTILRAKAFAAGRLDSETVTATYLINEPEERRNLPAVMLAGDSQQTLFKPYGVTAIQGGTYNGTTGWTPVDDNDYNLVIQRGKTFERSGSLEMAWPDGRPSFQKDCGLRVAASTAQRPQMTLQQLAGPWAVSDPDEKPSFNLFFREEHGGHLKQDIIPGAPVQNFASLRLRSGKNDMDSPFIADELTRRMTAATGLPTAQGLIACLYVNGIYRGFYNLCERVEEDSLRAWYDSNDGWDVIKGQAPVQVAAGTDPWIVEEGDNTAFKELITYVRDNDLTVQANYDFVASKLDLTSFIDYLLPSAWAVVLDWHMNNWVAARERKASAKFRFYTWDAEWGFNLQDSHWILQNKNVVRDWLLYANDYNANVPITVLFTKLQKNKEFRLLVADRIFQHFVDVGAPLSEAEIKALYQELRAPLEPLQKVVVGIPQTAAGYGWIDTWFNGGNNPDGVAVGPRNQYFFTHWRQYSCWPAVLTPTCNLTTGTVEAGTLLTLSNPNASGTIYYTLDGTDPRELGGTVRGTTYTGGIILQEHVELVARVYDGTSIWSPAIRRTFSVPQPKVILSELHYHPANEGLEDGDLFEFIELHNAGDAPARLSGYAFTDGVSFTFPQGFTLAPGAYAVVVSNATAFNRRYPDVPVAGVYTGNLSNGGETLTFSQPDLVTVFSVTYDDLAPWPTQADGTGPSLVLLEANANPALAESWRLSLRAGGSPGAADEPLGPTAEQFLGTFQTYGNGWSLSPWFGYFAVQDFPWIYHLDHNWLYAAGAGGDSCWFYEYTRQDWWWTSPALYPNIYSSKLGHWLYYLPGTRNPRWFYDQQAGTWFKE